MEVPGPRPFRLSPKTLLAFEGQSLMNIPADGGLAVVLPPLLSTDTYPVNGCINGTSMDTRSSSVASRIDQHAPRYTTSVCIFSNGQAEIQADDSGESIQAEEETYAAARRSAGFDYVIASTMPPLIVEESPGEYGITAEQEIERLAYNAALRASNAYDAIIDLDADPLFSTWTTAGYNVDGAHFSATGMARYAVLAQAALAEIGIT